MKFKTVFISKTRGTDPEKQRSLVETDKLLRFSPKPNFLNQLVN